MFAGAITDTKDVWPTLVLATIVLSIAWFLKPVVRSMWMVRNIPGPPGIPIVGHLFTGLGLTREKIHNKSREMHKKYGPLIALKVFNKIAVVVNNPVDAQIIFMNQEIKNRAPMFEKVVNFFMKDSLLTLRDDVWSSRRKLVNTALQYKVVVTYLDTFGKKAEELADILATVADGRMVDINDHLNLTAMSAIYQTAIGIKDEFDADTMRTLKNNTEEGGKLATARFINPLLWPLWIYDLTSNGRIARKMAKGVNDFVGSHIALTYDKIVKLGGKSKALTTAGEKKFQSYSDIVIETAIKEGNSLPASYVCSDVILLAVSGTESSASTMSYVLMLVGMHPEYQERLVEEQRAIFEDSLRPVQNEDISKMPLLEMVAKEALRLFPPVATTNRHIPFDLPISNGHVLPAGTFVPIHIFNIHHDPLNYVDPERFWPERWLPENSVGRHPCAWIPYGAGARNCVGIKYTQMQLKATLSRVLRQFRFSCDYTMEDLSKIEYGPFNRSIVGYNVRVVPR